MLRLRVQPQLVPSPLRAAYLGFGDIRSLVIVALSGAVTNDLFLFIFTASMTLNLQPPYYPSVFDRSTPNTDPELISLMEELANWREREIELEAQLKIYQATKAPLVEKITKRLENLGASRVYYRDLSVGWGLSRSFKEKFSFRKSQKEYIFNSYPEYTKKTLDKEKLLADIDAGVADAVDIKNELSIPDREDKYVMKFATLKSSQPHLIR